jgi:bifunctional UDP-N-acetylglucosamine pyrophosphorylase/glucosamine-1-phosphate N-acetyltransferase
MSANDIMHDDAYNQLKNEIDNNKNDGAIVCQEVDRYFPGGYIKIDDTHTIDSIIEKPGVGNEPSNLVNLVLHYHKNTARFFEVLESTQSTNDDIYECTLDILFKEQTYKALPYTHYWQPIKFPWHTLEAMGRFFEKISESGYIDKTAKIAPSAVIKGAVYIDEGVQVFDHATISGPAYIGKNSIVANNALVRGSMIGERCVVGYSTEIARSYLRSNVWTHSNYIGDSIIDDNVSFGAGSLTANLRLDEQEMVVDVKNNKTPTGRNKLGAIIGPAVRVGVQTALMPGVKIGSNSVIGPGLSIFSSIPKNSFVKPTPNYIVRENTQNVPAARL